MDDADALLIEEATFCKTGDIKRPGLVGTPDFATHQVCPDDLSMGATEVTTAVPTAWFARIMFDELLNPDVEELVPIKDPDTMQDTGQFTGTIENTQPVTLSCGGTAIAYGGYYNPGGNATTWPLGPSLFIQPVDLSTVATGSECTLSIKDLVVDKDGNKVPTDQQQGYKWKIDTLNLVGSSPAPAAPGKEPTIVAAAPLIVSFNGFIDAASIKATDVIVTEAACAAAACVAKDCETPGTAVAATVTADADDPLSIDIAKAGVAGASWVKAKAYTVSFKDGATAADVAKGTNALPGAADFSVCFLTK